jgi:hypothetical protein
MYGFHKKVGLSDNSMRASERKNKSPSEYSNPYFRRGHPDLLWLIQKPKNVSGPASKRKKTESEPNEEEMEDYGEESTNTPDTRVRAPPGQLTLGNLGNSQTALSQDQFKNVQRELAAIRHQQAQIGRMMQQISCTAKLPHSKISTTDMRTRSMRSLPSLRRSTTAAFKVVTTVFQAWRLFSITVPYQEMVQVTLMLLMSGISPSMISTLTAVARV